MRQLYGMAYNPFINKWSWSRFTSINYALHATKSITEHLEEDAKPITIVENSP